MLQFKNKTGFQGTVFASPDPDGIETLYTIVKATFDVGNSVLPSEEQVPVVMTDQHYDDPLKSSIRVPGDVSITKPATDVLLLGHAYAPRARAAYYTDVSVTVGPVSKYIRVLGDRVWEASGASYNPSAPQPFEMMPLVWERAYGGSEETTDGPAADPRNPVGRGFRSPKSGAPIGGRPMHNLEDPANPVTSWKQAVAPVSFGPVAPHWEPRKSFAGTYDDAWQKTRSPYLPADFNPRFLQIAAPGLTHPSGYLHGGEVVDVRGATPSGWLRFSLPQTRVQVIYNVAGSKETRHANLDTVIIEPDASRVVLVWRAALQCDKKLLKIKEIVAELTLAS